MDAPTGATIVASVINSSSLNCSSSSSSNSSSGYGSSQSAASTPIGSQYEATAHTPVTAPSEHVPPTATVAPVTPCYSETSLGQQQRQQYYQTYAYPNPASQYQIYDAYTGNSYHNLTTPSVERSLGLGSGYHIGSSVSSSSQHQRLEKSSKSSVLSSGTQLYTNSTASSLTTTTSSTTKPQATATPFFAQPSTNVSATNTAYYDTYGKCKMPSSTKMPSHAATDYASHLQHAVASLSYQQQQQHYYAAAKSQLQDATVKPPHRQHSVNNAASAYYSNSSAAYYDKYMYPPTASGAAYGAAASTHATHPYSPHEPTSADPYRKVAAAAAANAWHWNMEYAAGNCRNLPPTATGNSYLTSGSTTSSSGDAFCAVPNEKYSKYDKYGAYYANAHHQQYMTPQSSATNSRSLWPSTAHHTPHLASSMHHGLNERLTHTLPPSAAQHQYPHTLPHATTHHHYASAPTAAGTAQRQSCCAQPFQQQSCYYPRPSQQHAYTNATNPYAPPQQSQYGTGGASSTGSSHKYAAYSSSFKSNNSSNDLFVTSPFETTPPPAYNYGTTAATSLQSRYGGASNAAFYNDLNIPSAFDGFANTAIAQPPPMLQQHNVAAHTTHLGYQTHGSSQNPNTSVLLDYRKPTAAPNEYCLNKSHAPPLTAMEQHIGPASFLTFDIHGNPIAQSHSVITSPTIYSDGGSSSEKSTPTTKNIRDFLATWSEGEEEESAAAAASTVEQLSFVEGAPVQLQGRSYVIPEVDNGDKAQQDLNVYKNAHSATRPKIHVGITVDGSLDVDSSQFINLPDIVIDIEKSNTTATANGAAVSVINGATPAEIATEPTPPARTSSPLMEHHSPCGGSHEIFENFDVEKELDELQIKRAKLCLEKQLNNEIRILTPEPSEPQTCEATANPNEQQTTQQQILNTVQHTDCEKSYERTETFLKEMELNDTTSHSSNGSTFEKEYETFINRIENDKVDVDTQHRIRNESDTNASQVPMINEDSDSVSHQSSGIKTPPDPTDIDELAQKACQSVKPMNFSGNPEFEKREHEDFTDCVQDLTIHAAIQSSQKSMDESMALQNFEGPTQAMVVLPESVQTGTEISEVTKKLSENKPAAETNKIEAEDLTVSRDGQAAEQFLNSKLNELKLSASKSTDDFQNQVDFSIFYKKKRKFMQDLQDNENILIPSKQSKPNNEDSIFQLEKLEDTTKLKSKQAASKSKKVPPKRKRRSTSYFYKNLRHLVKARKVNTTALVQQHLAILKERHLPLIKRQSIKNYPTCDNLFYNPSSLKCLTVSMVNTNEFKNHLLVEMDKSQTCLIASDEKKLVELKNQLNGNIKDDDDETVNKMEIKSSDNAAESEPTNETEGNAVKEIVVECNESEFNATEVYFNENEEVNALRNVYEIENIQETKPEKFAQVIEHTQEAELQNDYGNEVLKQTVEGETKSCSQLDESANSVICQTFDSTIETTSSTKVNSSSNFVISETDNNAIAPPVDCLKEAKSNEVDDCTVLEYAEPQPNAKVVLNECSKETVIKSGLKTNTPLSQEIPKNENFSDALEEQSSTTVSENWSTSLKAQEEFNGFEDENSSKQHFTSNANSLSASLEDSLEIKDNNLTAKVLIKANNENTAPEISKNVNCTKPVESFISAENSSNAVEAEPSFKETDSSAPQLETKINEIGSSSKPATKPPTADIIISDTESEPEIVTQQTQVVTPTDAVHKFQHQPCASSSESNEQTTQLPPMRTKASVKMCDFSDARPKRKLHRERSKSKSLSSLQLNKRDKRSQRSLDAQKSATAADIKQKPTFEGIGKVDKTKFVENWAASIAAAANSSKLLFIGKTRAMHADSKEEALDLSPTSRQHSAKTSPIQIDENSNCSSSSSSSSSSSNSSCDNKSQTSSNSSSTSSQTTQSKTSTTSSTSQSSSNDSSTDGSNFNELKALEKELSQHKTHDDWANSVAQICEGEAADVAIKTDKIKLEIFETEATNQDIADLKKILESEEEEISEEVKVMHKNSSRQLETETETQAQMEEVCEESQIASLKYITEEFMMRQAAEAAKLKETKKLEKTEQTKEAAEVEVEEEEAEEEEEQQKQLIEIPKLSDLCKNALNSSFVVNEININHKTIYKNEKDNNLKGKEVMEGNHHHAHQHQQQQHQQHQENPISPPKNATKSTSKDIEKEAVEAATFESQASTVESQAATVESQASTVESQASSVESQASTVENQQPQEVAPQQQTEPQPAMTVEEELAEMYRQAGVAVTSDPEDNNDDVHGHFVGENYTENHAQDYLLINLAEILANTDNESNVFVLQCDMNENVLRVMTTSPRGDNTNELVIGEVANVDVENSSAVQIVQLVNAEDLQVAEQVETALLPPIPQPPPLPPPLPLSMPPPPPPLPSTSGNNNDNKNITTTSATTTLAANPLEQYLIDNDLSIIHHEEIVPDNYKKYQKEQFLKYLHEKYVQKHVKRFYHAHRISKKYRRRYYLSKNFNNSLATAVTATTTAAGAGAAAAQRSHS